MKWSSVVVLGCSHTKSASVHTDKGVGAEHMMGKCSGAIIVLNLVAGRRAQSDEVFYSDVHIEIASGGLRQLQFGKIGEIRQKVRLQSNVCKIECSQ